MTSKLTTQTFFDTARRRALEAKILLDAPRTWTLPTGRPLLGHTFDGAVVCGLLATECALKATLLRGHGANHWNDLPKTIADGIFDSSEGHKIHVLWDRQAVRMKDSAPKTLIDAIQKLSLPDRYDLRYGGRTLRGSEAKPFIECIDVVIEWMKQKWAP